jgi:hypothetical protein
MSSSNDSRDKDDLIGCLVECLNTLRWFARINFEGGGSLCTLLGEDALRFTDSSKSFGVPYLRFLLIPREAIVAAP